MQDHDNNSNNSNIRRMPGSEGRQASRSNAQTRPSGAPRSSGQPRRQTPDSQARPNGQPRRQMPDGQARPNGQPRRQAPDNGQARPNGQVRRPAPAGQAKPNGQARRPAPEGQPRKPAPAGRVRPNGQAKPNTQPRPNGKPQGAANGKPRKNPKKVAPQQTAKKKRIKILLFVAEIFLLLILVAALWTANKAKQIQHVEIKPEDVHINETVRNEIEQGTTTMKGYRNIALFGVDSRDQQLDKNTRTDVIMVASINQDTKEVRLVSVYRDTWLNMTNDKYSKANAAYATGGAKQAIGMLNMNLDLDITDFVTVGFEAVIDVVDAVGGIEIDVQEDEIAHLNSYQISMVGRVVGKNEKGEDMYEAIEGVEYTPVKHAGLQTLNGLQATAYSRIRYTSGGDLARAERQRTVLTKIAQKAMTLNPATINKIADAVFSEISTSLDMSEILSLLSDITSYQIGETAGFPFNDYVKPNGFVGDASVVVPIDLTKNVELLHEFLFDETDYTPTDTVKKCSQKIASDTGVSYNGE
ncbi:MAG: LCP family protein [Lachnospiraceae bacterium]|nr:LCP family protein [Lachnospiraceae bacterium]